MKKIALIASVAALAGAGIAFAADAPGGAPGTHRPDMHRTVARADAVAHASQMFERMDVNKDGKLDAADREARKAAMFDRIDTNKDGSISRAEFVAMRPGGGMRGPGMRHEGMNHDGMNHQEMAEGGMKPNGMMGGGMMGRGMRHRGMGQMMMRTADTNGDGAVTSSEFTAAAAARFDRMDTNHDGQLTAAERQAARATMREAMQRRGAPGNAPGAAN
jgi:Ca2+-binding EF-hand superfamily protein